MQLIRLIGLILLFSIIVGCTLFPAQKESVENSKVLLEIERSGCNGNCPVFSLKVLFDGSTIYIGEKFTSLVGVREFQLTSDQIAWIRSAFTRKGFIFLNDQCCGCVELKNKSSTRIVYQGNGPYKSITRYHGCLNQLSHNLKQLESEVLGITGVDRWIDDQ